MSILSRLFDSIQYLLKSIYLWQARLSTLYDARENAAHKQSEEVRKSNPGFDQEKLSIQEMKGIVLFGKTVHNPCNGKCQTPRGIFFEDAEHN